MEQPTSWVNYTLSKELIHSQVNEHTAVYHRLLGGLSLLDEASMGRTEELIQQLALRKLIKPSNEVTQISLEGSQEKKTDLVTVIQLVMANACNFGCTYCFEGVQGKNYLSKTR